MAEPLILALDEGTTSTRAILFDARGQAVAEAGRPIRLNDLRFWSVLL